MPSKCLRFGDNEGVAFGCQFTSKFISKFNIRMSKTCPYGDNIFLDSFLFLIVIIVLTVSYL